MSVQAEVSSSTNNINYLKYFDDASEATYINRVFLPSKNINVFPCSRRGQSSISAGELVYYDPEARLNTERTNRIGSSVNGFTNSFIVTNSNSFTAGTTLVFVLAGYYIEIKNFRPEEIAEVLKSPGSEPDKIYAHLGLQTDISLNVADYQTEILYRQATGPQNSNYLDVQHSSGTGANEISEDFFVGISFTASEPGSYGNGNNSIIGKNLLLFTKSGDRWSLEQTSLLPHIEHDTAEDSIKISGDFTVKHDSEAEFKVTATSATLNVPTTLKNDLDIVGTVNVDTINSSTTNGTITVGSPVKINDTLEVVSNLKVEDNINVGSLTDTEKATTDNGGCIVAKKDITAIQDLIAKRDVSAGGSATIAKNLTVGTDNNNNTGTITAKKEVITPKLRVDTITSNSGSILVDDKKLLVTKSLEVLAKKAIDEEDREEAAMATIDKAVIGQLDVITNTDLIGSTGIITAEKVQLKDIGQVPALELAQVSDDTYQLRFKFGSTLQIKDERPQASE